MPFRPTDTRLLRISRVSVTFAKCYLSQPQFHEANFTGATLEKEGKGAAASP